MRISTINKFIATLTKLSYLSDVTLAIQTQLNNKLSLTGGFITGDISCTRLTDSGTMALGKHGVNLATDHAPTNHLDIVIPTGAMNYVIVVEVAKIVFLLIFYHTATDT